MLGRKALDQFVSLLFSLAPAIGVRSFKNYPPSAYPLTSKPKLLPLPAQQLSSKTAAHGTTSVLASLLKDAAQMSDSYHAVSQSHARNIA